MPEEREDGLTPEPEETAPEGAPGEPGEATPAEETPPAEEARQAEETPPADEATPAEEAPQAEEASRAEDTAPADEGPQADAAPSDSPGAEIEGMEQLQSAVEQDAAAEGETPAAPEAEAPEAAEEAAPDASEQERPKRPKGKDDSPKEDVIPGAHLEPDLVLEEKPREEGEFGEFGVGFAEPEAAGEGDEAGGGEGDEAGGGEGAEDAEPVHTPLDLAADARYNATGKRKRAVARVILKPGEGTYSVNGRHLDEYFPRVRLQRMARQPLETAGYQTRLDVVARIHGGGVSAQANALRHGVARALVEADPALRGELKKRGYLTRDPRVKERKKAGLKKARKRPQFSKR